MRYCGSKISQGMLIVFTLIAFIFSNQTAAHAAPSNPLFIYISYTKDKSQFRWRILGSSEEQTIDVETAIDAPPLLGKMRVAFATRTNGVSVLDLTNGKQIHLGIEIEPAWFLFLDEYYAYHRSLMWSPDGQYLAFTGRTSAKRSDVYVYDSNDGTVVNLTEKLASTLNDVGSWSTHGHWLTFGGWIENNLEPFVASPDGKIITRLTPGQSACRLVWSPDNMHLTSTTECFQQELAADTNLIILTFDSRRPENPSSTRRIVSAKIGRLVSRKYETPRWYDNQTIIVARLIGPPYDITASPSDFIKKIILYDITTQREKPAPIPAKINAPNSTTVLDNWIVWYNNDLSHVYAYQVKRKQLLDLMGLSRCIEYILSDNGKFDAISPECDPASAHILRVVALPSRREMLNLRAQTGEKLSAIGFAEMP